MDGCFDNVRDALPKMSNNEDESFLGIIYSISDPLIKAERMSGASISELVRVGSRELIGEVIALQGDTATIQVFEDISSCQVGDVVLRTGKPLCVELGPGIMSSIFDGIQRPLQSLQENIYLPRGINGNSLSRDIKWNFKPLKFQEGDHVIAGDIIGEVVESTLMIHKIMVPPHVRGTLTFLAPAGDYTIDEQIYEIEFADAKRSFGMLQSWPVRSPRPYSQKLKPDTPIITGQRVIDILFPCYQGGVMAVPVNSGKDGILFCYSKYSNSDCIISIGCAERGNELAESILQFPEINVVVDGEVQPLMNRSTLIANSCNMPVAVREASIYSGMTIAEYYRDMGLNVSIIADSLSRWAESLQEVSVCVEGVAADTHLRNRLCSLVERAGKVLCCGSDHPERYGSVSIVGVISPLGFSEFSDLTTNSILELSNTFWYLDRNLAKIRHFPSINWTLSFTKCFENLESYYHQQSDMSEFLTLKDKCSQILLLGEKGYQRYSSSSNNSSDCCKVEWSILKELEKLVRECFLAQNSFTVYDQFCPLYKSVWMLRNIILFYDLSMKAANYYFESDPFFRIGNHPELEALLRRLSDMRFEDPSDGQVKLIVFYKQLHDDILKYFNSLRE